MKVAIIGPNGQLGSDLVKAFVDDEIVLFTHTDLDVTDYSSLMNIKNSNPDIIINTAAYHKTDDCEDNPEKTFAFNALGAKNIALIGSELGAIVVYISTDYVFDGCKNSSYSEDDIVNPTNTYGISKVAGEFYTKLTAKHYIIRVASLFGIAGATGKGGNFIEAIIKKAHNGEDVKVVDDIIMSPTYTRDLAGMIKNIIDKELPFGIYHVTNNGQCSWYDLAALTFEMLDMDPNLSPTKTDILQSKARRPMYSPLISVKLEQYALEMESWEEALKNYLMEKGHLK